MDNTMKTLLRIPVAEIIKALRLDAAEGGKLLVMDGIVTQHLIDVADKAGIERGPDDRVWPEFSPVELTELDLRKAGISSVLWTSGYAPDYSWLDLPILDEFGTPRHVRGVSEVPGLMMLGMLFQHDNASANLVGIARDAAYLASRLE